MHTPKFKIIRDYRPADTVGNRTAGRTSQITFGSEQHHLLSDWIIAADRVESRGLHARGPLLIRRFQSAVSSCGRAPLLLG